MTATVRSNGFQGRAQFWAESVKHLYVSSFRYFADALSQRLLPPFSNLEAEAEQFAENEYARLGTVPSLQESDAADVADLANDNAVTWYTSMAAVRQSVINLHAVGLRHLFEQQVFDLVLHVPLRAAATAKSRSYRGHNKRPIPIELAAAIRVVWRQAEAFAAAGSIERSGLMPQSGSLLQRLNTYDERFLRLQ